MYNILNDYYFQESDNHYLASLLSDMDSNVFMDKMSADPATYFDWLSCVERYIVNEEIKDENIILYFYNFIISNPIFIKSNIYHIYIFFYTFN